MLSLLREHFPHTHTHTPAKKKKKNNEGIYPLKSDYKLTLGRVAKMGRRDGVAHPCVL